MHIFQHPRGYDLLPGPQQVGRLFPSLANAEVTASVAIITYNHEKYIAQTLESALSQFTSFNFEIVVGEDGSNDRTRSILLAFQRKFPSRIRVLLQSENVGSHRNFADTIKACRGRYIAVLDGDDFWISPDKLQRQVEFLESHPSYAICGHQLWRVDASGRGLQAPRTNKALRRHHTFTDLILWNPLSASSVVFRRGLFDQFPRWWFGDIIGDWTFHLLNARGGDTYVFPDEWGAYRLHTQSLTSQTEQIFRKQLNTRRVLDGWLPPELLNFNRLGYALTYFQQAKFYMATQQPVRARECFHKAWDYTPASHSRTLYHAVESALHVYAPPTISFARSCRNLLADLTT